MNNLYNFIPNHFSFQSCSGTDDDDDDENGGNGGGGGDGDEEGEGEEGLSSQEQEEQKQRLLFEQNRLSERGAAEMVLLELAASKGEIDRTEFLIVIYCN